MRRLGLCSIAAAVAIAGCGPASVTPPSVSAGGASWKAMIRTMPAVATLHSTNICGDGSPACIDAVVAEMTRRFDVLNASCSHEAPFALLYLRVTEGVGIQGARRFRNRDYLNHLDAVFANLYFTAYDNWRAGRTKLVPEAWRIAFQAADQGTVSVLGDILLGMNAHISRDLPFALARAGLREPNGQSAEGDFNRVNGLLGSVTADSLAEEATRYDPTLGTVLQAARLYPVDVQQLLAGWRSNSWNDAERLLAARTPTQRAAVARSIEAGATGRARLIEAVTSNLVTGPDAAVRNAYCERRLRKSTARS
jgi:hypothetical protein